MAALRALAAGLEPLGMSAGGAEGRAARGGEAGAAVSRPPPPSSSTVVEPAEGGSGASTSRRRIPSRLLPDVATQIAMVVAQGINGITSLHKAQGPWLLRAQPAIISCILFSSLLFMLLRTRTYMRHRLALLFGMRSVIALFPSVRSLTSGTALALYRPPRPGLLAFVRDFFRVGVGMRTLPTAMYFCFVLIDPAWALADCCVTVALQWNSPGYCSTPMLHHPLSESRISGVAWLLEQASLPLAAVQPVAGGLVPHTSILAGTAPAHQLCTATISFMHLAIGVFVPLLYGAFHWPAPKPASPRRPADRGWRGRALRAGQRANVLAFRVLKRVAAVDSRPLVRLACWWYVAANLWLLCKLSAGL